MNTRLLSIKNSFKALWDRFTAPGALKTSHYGRIRSSGFRLFHICGILFLVNLLIGAILVNFVPSAKDLIVAIGIGLITGWLIGSGLFLLGPDRKSKFSA